MEEEKENKEEICYMEKIKNMVKHEIEQISNTELNEKNLDLLDTLIDINKDLENIDYWNVKKEAIKMRYSDYDNYSEGRYSEGRYGNYGRRGVPGSGRRYRGYDECEDILNEMKDSYKDYYESKMSYNRGNYNAGEDSMKALEDTMRIFTEFTQKMIDEVDDPEAKQIIKKHLRKISQME